MPLAPNLSNEKDSKSSTIYCQDLEFEFRQTEVSSTRKGIWCVGGSSNFTPRPMIHIRTSGWFVRVRSRERSSVVREVVTGGSSRTF